MEDKKGKKEDAKERLKAGAAGLACLAAGVLAIAAETICLTKLKNRKK